MKLYKPTLSELAMWAIVYTVILGGTFMCKYIKPACDTIDLIDNGCHVFILPSDKGGYEKIQMNNKEAAVFLRTGKRVEMGGCK